MDRRDWIRRTGVQVLFVLLLFQYNSLQRSVAAQGVLRGDLTTPQATPLQEDATLNDLALSEQQVWVVGDRGTIWYTKDAGRRWEFVRALPHLENYTLESVQFLTDRVGWIAGGTVSSVGHVQHGVLLATLDGGANWEVLAPGQLPYLRSVRFFDLEHGIAIGERTTNFPSGVMTTNDGGKSWNPVNSQKNATWNAAEFFNSETGLVVGPQGTQAVIANGAVLSGGGNVGGLQGFHDISIDSRGTCWIVGDGAMVLVSRDQGVTWSPPPTMLPNDLQSFTDFHSVTHHERDVWIVGSPGSVIWHSPDDGQTWERQKTNDSAPLKTVQFRGKKFGMAAGLFGRICVTWDGGQSWENVRGENRRLACWALHGYKTRVPFGFLTRWSREAGYRSAVTLVVRRDLGADAYFSQDDRVRLEQAVLAAGGNAASIDWRLPVTLPGLDRNAEKLAKEWSRLTDQQFSEVMLSHLVSQIRLWKPDVILLDEPPPGDAVTRLIQQALPEAVEQAQNANLYPEHFVAGLAPWRVGKVVMERSVGQSGSISQDPFEILPHVGTTLDLATLQSTSRIFPETDDVSHARSYEVLYLAPGSELSKGTVFNDLQISLNSAARRAVPPLTAIDFDRLLDEARHRHSMTGITRGMMKSPEQSAQLLAQLGDILKPLSPEQASRQLASLAVGFRESGQWTLAEETFSQIILNYPEQPAALEAMLWLVAYSSSAEMNWQRLSTIRAGKSNSRVDQAGVQANFRKALEISSRNATQAGFFAEVAELQAGVEVNSSPLVPTLGSSAAVLNGKVPGTNQYDQQIQRWQETAANIVKDLSSVYPRLFEEDEMQFVVAALYRRRQQGRKGDEIYGRYLQKLNDDDPWHVAAKGEVFLLQPGALSPKPVISCKTTLIAPVLDGRLIDPCWSEAGELKLTQPTRTDSFVGTKQRLGGRVEYLERQPIVMFSRDAEYLYIGANMPKHAKVTYAATQQPGRPRDADLGEHDYLSLQFDIDRDYSTYYRFDIDQRGWSREACWDSWNYNPNWFIATEQDAASWTIEVAIPLKELLPSEPLPQQVWALGVTRVLPGEGVQSWTNSGGEKPLPPRFGFLRFE